MTTPLAGIEVVCATIYLPALLTMRRLASLGAHVRVVEPPHGNSMRAWAPAWHDAMYGDAEVLRIDWKGAEGQATLDATLARTDVLVTSSRPAALERVGLGPAQLLARFPSLCSVAIVGYPPPNDDEPGHDLTCQASLGLIRAPDLPRTLIADIAGSERATTAAVSLLLARERGRPERSIMVSLQEAAEPFAEPWRHRMTTPDAILGGAFARYNIYAAQDGWVAVAALESHFWKRLAERLTPGVTEPTRDQLAAVFATRAADAWEAFGRETNLPIAKVV